MAPSRREVDAWWRAPAASMLLVAAGLIIVFIEVGRGGDADAAGYSAGLALIGLGVTGRIQAWLLPGRPESDEKPKDE